MKKYFSFLLFFVIISCSSKKDINYESSLINSLHNLEKSLYSNPSIILDSIAFFNENGLESISQAYSNLLYAIAHEQKYGVFKNDSLTNKAAQLFKEHRDNYNYSRALLYTSIAQYYKNRYDSVAYNNLRLVEAIAKENNIVDNNLYATLYLYLGRYYGTNLNAQIAKEKLNKSLEFSQKAANKNTTLNVSLEKFNLNITEQKHKEAITALSHFGDVIEMPPYIAYNLHTSMYYYYFSKGEYRIAIEYLNKNLQIDPRELKIEKNEPKIYYQLSHVYKKLNLSDSSLFYARAAVEAIKDSTAQGSHFYYRYLADILYNKKQYAKAAELYKTAHITYIYSFAKLARQRELELSAKFNFEEQKRENNLIKTQRTLILNLLLISIALLIIVSLSYFFYSRNNREMLYKINQELDVLKKEHNSSWLISEIFKTTSYILPQLIDNISQEAARSRRVSKEMYDSLNKIIDVANGASRASITDIANNEYFDHIFGGIHNLDSLTDFEKLVYALNKVGHSNVEIAHFLNSSQSSIRTIKGRISRKMQNIETNNNSNS